MEDVLLGPLPIGTSTSLVVECVMLSVAPVRPGSLVSPIFDIT